MVYEKFCVTSPKLDASLEDIIRGYFMLTGEEFIEAWFQTYYLARLVSRFREIRITHSRNDREQGFMMLFSHPFDALMGWYVETRFFTDSNLGLIRVEQSRRIAILLPYPGEIESLSRETNRQRRNHRDQQRISRRFQFHLYGKFRSIIRLAMHRQNLQPDCHVGGMAKFFRLLFTNALRLSSIPMVEER